MVTGASLTTYKSLQLDAGVFLVNFDYSNIDSVSGLKAAIATALETRINYLGATRGGGTFEAVPDTREVEVDGVHSPFVGSTKINSWDIRLTTTLIEVTPNQIRRALGAATTSNLSPLVTITINNQYSDHSYLQHLCWVGDTSEGLVLIELDNALNVGGLTLTFTDQGEGTFPVEFVAHQGSLTAGNTAPARIIFFGGEMSSPEQGDIGGTGAAGTTGEDEPTGTTGSNP